MCLVCQRLSKSDSMAGAEEGRRDESDEVRAFAETRTCRAWLDIMRTWVIAGQELKQGGQLRDCRNADERRLRPTP